MRNLILDRGNYRIKWAVFDDGQIAVHHATDKLSTAQLQSLITRFEPKNIFLSNVAPVHFDIDQIDLNVQLLDENTPLPFTNNYETPKTLGRDRLCVLAAAQAEWPKRNVMVIDTGTCLTIDVLSKKGVFKGGTISPGPELRYLAMNEHTATLPLVQRNENFELIGKNTYEAVQNGGFAACVAEINGWIEVAKTRFEDMVVVISGRDGLKFAKYLKKPIFVRSNLVLRGLNEIQKFNAK